MGKGLERPGEGAVEAWRGLERELVCGLSEEPLAVLAALFRMTDSHGSVSGSTCRVRGACSWGPVHRLEFMGACS